MVFTTEYRPDGGICGHRCYTFNSHKPQLKNCRTPLYERKPANVLIYYGPDVNAWIE